MNKIEQFIKDNSLDFTGSGSELNGNLCILAGYADYLKLSEEELMKLIPNFDIEVIKELYRIFQYSKLKNYGNKWHTEEYKTKFKY